MNLQAGSIQYFRVACILVLLSAALFGMPARTQEVTAGITGAVTDPNGAAVGGALVTATDTQRGTSFSTRSDADGLYYLQRIPVGTYQLRVESEPFSTATLPPFTLVLNQIARLDFHLVLGPQGGGSGIRRSAVAADANHRSEHDHRCGNKRGFAVGQPPLKVAQDAIEEELLL